MRILYKPQMLRGSITVSKLMVGLVKTPVFSALYNQFTATDARGIAPEGWHVSTIIEMQTLQTTLGGVSVAGGKMKEAGYDWFESPNTGADNSSGFNGRGSSMRDSDGTWYAQLKYIFVMWSSTSANATYARLGELSKDSANFLADSYGASDKKRGASIRLIKDDSTWSQGDTVTDFDGNKYPTVKIGNQVWMAAGLIVEHFNNGDSIPYIGGNASWAALTTPGMCYFGNIISNGYTVSAGGLVADNTQFSVTVTGQKPINPKIVEKQVSQLTQAVFNKLPYDTYAITEGSQPGYTQVSVVPDEVVLSAGAPGDEVTITNSLNAYLPYMELSWDNIANVPVADASSVANWNTFFELPVYGCAFTSVEVTGNLVRLMGGWGITIKNTRFQNNTHLTAFEDASGCVTNAGDLCFNGCTSVTLFYFPSLLKAGNSCFIYCTSPTISCPKLVFADALCFANTAMGTCYFPALVSVGAGCFQDCIVTTIFDLPLATSIGSYGFNRCYAAVTFNLPSMTNLGGSTSSNGVFNSIAGNTITLTVPSALMTCWNNTPDLDIQTLQLGNTVNVIQV